MDGEIGEHGEVDEYRFELEQAGRYVIETAGRTDVVMSLHGPGSDAVLVAADDDSGLGLNARIERELLPGRYVVRVRHYRPRGSGTYQVAVHAA